MDFGLILILFILVALIAGTIWFYKLIYNFFIALFSSKGKGEEYDYENEIEDFGY